jgi:serine/threonine-protein kinase
MPAKVTLTIIQGKHQGKELAFDERTTCLVGRGEDCQLQLPSDDDHRLVSRHHCLLDINPPGIRVRDFGSRNGTYVNGLKIGQRAAHLSAEEAAGLVFPEHDLLDGDEIKLGQTVFSVAITRPAFCASCQREIPAEQRAAAERAPGYYQCASCQPTGEQTLTALPPADVRSCARCGRDVSHEEGSDRPGDYLCAVCKADPLALVQGLLRQAKAGGKTVVDIEGYEIRRELGRGGMGAVYLAEHTATGEPVALKVMLPRVAADDRARRMFLRETDNTRALRHPNVVQFRDSGCSGGAFFLTLEYCDGGNVGELVKRRGAPLAVDEALAILLPALDGLEYAHQAEVPFIRQPDSSFGPGRGLVHRDLKPSNLFLCGSEGSRTVKIGDYGLAKAFDSAGLSGFTCTGTVAGTPFFMPRQQLINFKYARPEVDVWSMAATLYYLLTMSTPRDFPRDQDWNRIVLETPAVPLRERNPAVPARLAEVVDLALVDKPAIPFKSAAEFKRALESV